MPLPPYLTSFASSRAHHALLVKLDGAASAQAEDAAVIQEVERCRNLLATNPSSVSNPTRLATGLGGSWGELQLTCGF